MKKTSLLPLVIIVATFLIIPIAFWFLTSKNSDGNIQGAKTKGDSAGVIVNIKSSQGTWDLNKYLCKSEKECLESLVAGKSLETISGGVVENKLITIKYASDWDSYEFLKIFVKPGWGSTLRKFDASLVNGVSEVYMESFVYGESDYDVVLVPIKNIKDTLLEVATFSDL